MYGRLPHPVTQSGSGVLVATSPPKFALAIAPHLPLSVVSLRSQSGRKLPLTSVQERVVLFTDALAGSKKFAIPVVLERTYRLMPALIAVLPSPNGSHATPNRGLRSFQFGTSSTAAKVRAGTSGPAGSLIAGTDSWTQSNRNPALIVKRPTRHWS